MAKNVKSGRRGFAKLVAAAIRPLEMFLIAATGPYNSEAYSGDISVTPLAAVPEPETCAMLMAGLGFPGVVVRPRKNKQQ